MFELNLSVIGWTHTVASVVAMLAVVPIILARKGSPRHRAWGRAYAKTHAVVTFAFVILIGGYVGASALGQAPRRQSGPVSP